MVTSALFSSSLRHFSTLHFSVYSIAIQLLCAANLDVNEVVARFWQSEVVGLVVRVPLNPLANTVTIAGQVKAAVH